MIPFFIETGFMAKNKLKIIIIGLLILVVCLVMGGAFFFLKISSFAKEPLNPAADKKFFTIQPGQSLAVIAKKLEKRGAEAIVLGCTDLPIILKQEDLNIRIFDTAEILAESTIKFATEQKKDYLKYKIGGVTRWIQQ